MIYKTIIVYKKKLPNFPAADIRRWETKLGTLLYPTVLNTYNYTQYLILYLYVTQQRYLETCLKHIKYINIIHIHRKVFGVVFLYIMRKCSIHANYYYFVHSYMICI